MKNNNRPLKKWFPTGLLALLLLLPVPAAAMEELPLATVEFPPFHFNRDGRVAGFMTEIVEMTVKRMGYRPKIGIYPSKRGKSLVEEGELAGIFAFTKNRERLEKHYFTRALGTIRDVFFKRRDRNLTWKTLSDLKPYLIGATDTHNYAPVFMNAIKDGTIHTEMVVSINPEIIHLRKLLANRIDLAICEISVCKHVQRQNAPEFDELDHIERTIGPVRTFHLGFSKKWPGSAALTKRFDAALMALEKEGKVAEIYARYGFSPYEE